MNLNSIRAECQKISYIQYSWNQIEVSVLFSSNFFCIGNMRYEKLLTNHNSKVKNDFEKSPSGLLFSSQYVTFWCNFFATTLIFLVHLLVSSSMHQSQAFGHIYRVYIDFSVHFNFGFGILMEKLQ